jgi:hypothetical protein
MRTMRAILGLMMLVLAACGDDGSPPPESTPDVTETPPTTATLSPVLVALQRDYERISASQAAILTIWEDLATDSQVQCGSYPAIISPEGISAEGDAAYTGLADLLRGAALDTAHAIELWQAECLNPRAVIPPDVIDEGRFAARSAGDTLREAQTLLEAIQGE